MEWGIGEGGAAKKREGRKKAKIIILHLIAIRPSHIGILTVVFCDCARLPFHTELKSTDFDTEK